MSSIQFFATNAYSAVRSYTVDHPVGKSILGRIALCAGLELMGGMVGSSMGAVFMGKTLQRLGLVVIPAVATMGLYYGLHKKTRLAALAILGASAAGITIPLAYGALYSWGGQVGLAIGTWVGKNGGMILGGYAALKMADCNLPFWDPTMQADSYAVGMTKYILAGEIFNRTVAQATLPFLHIPLNLMRGGCEAIVKSLAYNSNPLISLLKKLFREKELSQDVLLPFVVKVFCNKYSEKNAVPITTKLIRLVSQTLNILPSAAEKLSFLLRQPVIFAQVQGLVESLGANSDRYTAILMRAFNEYSDKIDKSQDCQKAGSNLKLLKATLKKEINGASTLSQIISPICGEQINQLAKSILDAIRQSEQELTGYTFTQTAKKSEPEEIDSFEVDLVEIDSLDMDPVEIDPLERDDVEIERLLAIHIKYYLIYVLLNYNGSPLTLDEEKTFFEILGKRFFSLYDHPSYPHKIVRCAEKVILASVSAFFRFKKWIYPLIEQPEQIGLVSEPIQIMENYNQGFLQ